MKFLTFDHAGGIRPLRATRERSSSGSVESNEANWTEAPNYSYVERDVGDKGDLAEAVKTFDIFMIDDSPYRRLIALNDQPLSSERPAEEARKLQGEIDKRQHEPKRERDMRIAGYARARDQDHAMLREMADAFDYTLVGDQNIGGHEACVLRRGVESRLSPEES